MNRYITDGILRDAAAGKDVTIVAPTRYQATHELLLAIEAAPDAWTRTSRANGNEHALHEGGGTVRPLAANASIRGRSGVLLALDHRFMSEKQRDEVFAARHAMEILLNC